MWWKRYGRLTVTATVALTSVISGCTIYVPDSVKKEASVDGLASTYVKSIMGFVYLTSASFVPGKEAVNGPGNMRMHTCDQDGVKARVEWMDDAVADREATTACHLVASSIAYMSRFNQRNRFSSGFEYKAYLSPPGAKKEIKRRSLYPITKLAPLFIVAWGLDSEKNKANLVDVFAHEYVHIHAALNGIKTSLDYEEETAYLAGACAQLNTNELITGKSLPGAPILKSADTPDAVVYSSNAAYEFRQYLLELMEDGRILLDSKGGERLNTRCQTELAKFFSTAS